ncbi:hypothetical protein EIP91_008296 [Steccherinum ochraceum]|uniref:Uncharacterized protein n=1 Tax=Steccherinum ochraceum TaxID=92696 RepID=A0A4R0R8Q4_9APHY|nr:hypothetical protein EIP91_008296 [Steccherinum ochraceum]
MLQTAVSATEQHEDPIPLPLQCGVLVKTAYKDWTTVSTKPQPGAGRLLPNFDDFYDLTTINHFYRPPPTSSMRFSTAFATVLAIACTSALAAPTAITARDVEAVFTRNAASDLALRELIGGLYARDLDQSAMEKRARAPPSRSPSPGPSGSHPNGAPNGATNGASNGATNGHPTNGAPNGATNGHPTNGATNGATNGHPTSGDNGAPEGENGGGGQNLPTHFPQTLGGQVGTAPQPHTPVVTTHNPESENAPEQSAPVEEWPGRRRMFDARRHLHENALRKRARAPPSRSPSPGPSGSHPNGAPNGATNGATNGHPTNGAPNGATNGHPTNGATNGATNGHPTNGENGAPEGENGGGQNLPTHFPPTLGGQVGTAPQPHTPVVTTHNPESENAPEQSAPVEEWPGRRMFWGRAFESS